MHQSYPYHICQQNGDDFPPPLRQDIEAVELRTILNTSNRKRITLYTKFDTPVHVVTSLTFFDHRLFQMRQGIAAHVRRPKV
jgi:hypothetical protein